MDRYHVYEELGAGTHSQVFKGRRKKSIEYVAIKRVDKRKIDNVIQEINVSSSQISAFRDGWAQIAVFPS